MWERTTTDETALERLFREEAPGLWRSLVLATGDAHGAEDAVAEAFAQALRLGDRLRDPRAWIWRVGFLLATRESSRRRTLEPLDGEIVAQAPDDLVDILRGLAQLTAHQRTAVVLADYAGFSHREIAEILASTVSAVGVHVYRGRRRLRQILGDNDG